MAKAASVDAVASRLDVDTSVARAEDGGIVMQPEEAVVCPVANVEWVFGDSLSAGQGSLMLTTQRVVWVGASTAFALRYQQVVMHAICRDPEAFAKPCLYLQLDVGSEDMNVADDGEEGEEGEDEQVAAEVRLVPEDATTVDELFKVLCDCAALNPDSDAEGSGEGDFFFNEDEVMAGLDATTRSAVMAARLAGGMALGDGDDADNVGAPGAGQYDDADEDEEYDDEADGGAALNGGDGRGDGELRQLVGNDPGRFEDEDEDEDGMDADPPHANHTS